MLRRAKDAKSSGSNPHRAPHIALIDQKRHRPREVVEDIETGPRFDDRKERHDRSTGNERLRQKVDLVESANQARVK